MRSFCLRFVTLCLLAPPLLTGAAQPAPAQTYTVLHTFTGGDDGGNPRTGGLLIDAAGNLYGGAGDGGPCRNECLYQGCGVIFRLSPRAGDWVFSTLYSFQGGSDGSQPDQVLCFGPNG